MDGKTVTYVIHPDCPICKAVDPYTKKDLRLKIDKKIIDGDAMSVISKWLRDEHGISVSVQRLKTHTAKHSEYIGTIKTQIQDMVKEKSLNQISTIADEYIPAEEVLTDIITKGGQKIRAGEINVDGKLLISAIHEEGSRKKVGTLRELWDSVNRGRFPTVEGEIVN